MNWLQKRIERQKRIDRAREISKANRPTGDSTRPHLKKQFKVVPMRDSKGNIIPDNPAVVMGGPWKVDHGIKVNEQNQASAKSH